MTRVYFFRPLNPTAKYPASPIDLSFDGVRYDLSLPPRVGIALARLLSAKGSFKRIERFCSPTGFNQLRANPNSFEPNVRLAAYAESEIHVEAVEHDVLLGYIIQRAAGNAASAKQILKSVIDGGFTFDVIDWIFGHAPFLDNSGGFEIAHVCCYATAEEREIAIAAANGDFDDAEPDLYQPHVTTIQLERVKTDLERRLCCP